MKKHILVFSVLLLTLISLCSCKQNSEEPSSASSSDRPVVSVVTDESSAEESSLVSRSETSENKQQESTLQPSESTDNSAPAVLPAGVSRAGKGKLNFTSSVLTLNITFPQEFCVLNNDYAPLYGIYLQNREGTATLLLSSVEDNTLTYHEMMDYLKKQFPSAKVYTTDKKEVVCKLDTTDTNGNNISVLQKFRMKKGGYHQVALCCRQNDKAKYEKVLNEVVFS